MHVNWCKSRFQGLVLFCSTRPEQEVPRRALGQNQLQEQQQRPPRTISIQLRPIHVHPSRPVRTAVTESLCQCMRLAPRECQATGLRARGSPCIPPQPWLTALGGASVPAGVSC